MKSLILFLIVLFFVITPAYGQLLSDATGLVNKFKIQTSGHIFEIKLTSNFDFNNFNFEKEKKQLTLYFDSSLENNLGEIIIPTNLLSGDFKFYLNNEEFFPKIQSNEKINFITLNFTGSGSNVVSITGSEYLLGLDEIIPIENEISEIPDRNDLSLVREKSDKTSSNDYLIWLMVGGIVIVIVVFIGVKFLKK